MWPRVCVHEGNIYTYSGMTLETISSCVCSQIDLVGLVFFPLFSVHFFLCFYFQPLHSNACSLVRLFHLSRLHTVDTCPPPPAHTHALSSPQHLVPCAPKSVFMILPGSPFHFASLYLSHIALKIEGNWARRWEEEYPCWDSFWTSAKHTRAPTHAQTSSTQISSSFYLILEGLRAGKES